MSQKQDILEHLKAGNTLSSRQCQNLFNCDRLSARIRELREDGNVITTLIVRGSRKGKTHAVYFMGTAVKRKWQKQYEILSKKTCW